MCSATDWYCWKTTSDAVSVWKLVASGSASSRCCRATGAATAAAAEEGKAPAAAAAEFARADAALNPPAAAAAAEFAADAATCVSSLASLRSSFLVAAGFCSWTCNWARTRATSACKRC